MLVFAVIVSRLIRLWLIALNVVAFAPTFILFMGINYLTGFWFLLRRDIHYSTVFLYPAIFITTLYPHVCTLFYKYVLSMCRTHIAISLVTNQTKTIIILMTLGVHHYIPTKYQPSLWYMAHCLTRHRAFKGGVFYIIST